MTATTSTWHIPPNRPKINKEGPAFLTLAMWTVSIEETAP